MAALKGIRNLSARFGGLTPILNGGFAAGALANTDITLTGIRPGDIILVALVLQPPTAGSGNAIASDQASAVTITANDTIRCTNSTAGNQLLVFWYTASLH